MFNWPAEVQMDDENNWRYAEDYIVGDVFELGTYDITQEEIIEFSRKYDPFPFHVDEQLAQQTVFAGIISIDHLNSPMAG